MAMGKLMCSHRPLLGFHRAAVFLGLSAFESRRDRVPFRPPFLKSAEHRPHIRQTAPP
jgi:hypothetical protein